MSWSITESETTLKLDSTLHGEVTFTVTNTSQVRDRSVLTLTPLDGASESWYRLEDPQRVVLPGDSEPYLVEVAVPPTTPPGTYGVQALVYSADTDPSESSVTSNPVRFTIEPPDRRSGPPMWLVVLVIVWVVLVIIGITIAFLTA